MLPWKAKAKVSPKDTGGNDVEVGTPHAGSVHPQQGTRIPGHMTIRSTSLVTVRSDALREQALEEEERNGQQQQQPNSPKGQDDAPGWAPIEFIKRKLHDYGDQWHEFQNRSPGKARAVLMLVGTLQGALFVLDMYTDIQVRMHVAVALHSARSTWHLHVRCSSTWHRHGYVLFSTRHDPSRA